MNYVTFFMSSSLVVRKTQITLKYFMVLSGHFQRGRRYILFCKFKIGAIFLNNFIGRKIKIMQISCKLLSCKNSSHLSTVAKLLNDVFFSGEMGDWEEKTCWFIFTTRNIVDDNILVKRKKKYCHYKKRNISK